MVGEGISEDSSSVSDGVQSSKQLLECNAIFESRKDEIIDQVRQLDEKKQAIEALQNASQNILNQREAKLKEREKALSLKLKEIQEQENKAKQINDEKETKIKNLITKNEEILKAINGAKNNKLALTYAKMKDSKAAPIIENLPQDEAASILFALSAQDMGKILSKMDPKKAAELTEILKKGPPFESSIPEQISQQNKNQEQKEITHDQDINKNNSSI
ncbi:hypothetical protein BKH45_03740 [Helicobacter sp. 11S03491-1]|nr:hypothetical protein BKH45_03740 [Helicobacter sp. 11S03491-1]